MFTDTTRLESACQAKLQAGTTLDEVIVYLHGQGLSILDTIKVIRQVGRISLGDAKQIVSHHTVWQQTVKANEALHDAAEAAAQTTGTPPT